DRRHRAAGPVGRRVRRPGRTGLCGPGGRGRSAAGRRRRPVGVAQAPSSSVAL
ncbi:MAG: hypothetical protein AVDCRST_MAG19-3284, partial [uncultured Thermomicrobiales bacterium]